MKIEATTAEMLAVCHTQIAIADNMSSMGLTTKDGKEINNTWQLMWQLHKAPHSRDSKGLHLPFLSKDQSLETEVQEV